MVARGCCAALWLADTRLTRLTGGASLASLGQELKLPHRFKLMCYSFSVTNYDAVFHSNLSWELTLHTKFTQHTRSTLTAHAQHTHSTRTAHSQHTHRLNQRWFLKQFFGRILGQSSVNLADLPRPRPKQPILGVTEAEASVDPWDGLILQLLTLFRLPLI